MKQVSGFGDTTAGVGILIALAIALPALAPPALLIAGALMAGVQIHVKAQLILAAGHFRPITLGGLRVRRLVGTGGRS